MAEAIPFEAMNGELEVEFHRKLYDSRTLFYRRFAKIRVLLGNHSSGRILHELERQVSSIRKRPQRMIQEVVPVDTELKALRLADLEVLEDRRVPVEVGWAV